ncbi:MAG TPA: DHH family phosphoesterase [Opitutales bacterium]|nr:DHH family phosphoesterase [Opitutales bacterium]
MDEISQRAHCTASDGPVLAAKLRSFSGAKAAVAGHVRPDGDCIGSQVALTRVLIALGCDAVAVNEHSVPRTQRNFVGDTPFFLPGQVPDLRERRVLSVDCASFKRLGTGVLSRIGPVELNIDHHISNERFAAENYIYPSACATSEVLGCLFLDNALPVDAVTAQALYVGIATDTGQFKFASTTAHSFELCCELMARGANPAAAARDIYENESRAKIRLLTAFLQSLSFEFGGRVCIGILPESTFVLTGAEREDVEGLVDYARDIEGVEIGVCLEYRGGTVKGSFRAKDPSRRVDILASKFGGGGHAAAAGFNCDMAPETFYPAMIAAIAELLGAQEAN